MKRPDVPDWTLEEMDEKLPAPTAEPSAPIVSPPPYTTDAAEKAIQGTVRAKHSTGLNPKGETIPVSSPAGKEHLDKEIDRIRNFMLYIISVDYQCDTGVHLSAADRDHFLALWARVVDLTETHKVVSLESIEKGLAREHHLIYIGVPCRHLRISTCHVLCAIQRMAGFSDQNGRYHGSCASICLGKGVSQLATKIYVDEKLIVPTVTRDPLVREKLYAGIARVRSIYFDRIYGIDSYATGSFIDTQVINFDLNQAGRKAEALYQRTQNGDSGSTPRDVWLKRFGVCINGFLTRFTDAKGRK